MADQRVSVFDFFDDLRWNAPSACHVPKKFRNVVDRVRRTMREQENGPRIRFGDCAQVCGS